MRMRTAALVGVVAAGLAAAAGAARAQEDDLAVVKRAVARQEVKGEVRVADPVLRNEPPAAPRKAAELKWLKVRVTEKGTKRAKVTINLPIGLVRALGEDYPIDFGRRHWHEDGAKRVRLGEVLAALEAGSPLVEIDDDEAFVRVWVE
jgi:hypothetical protein